MKLFQSTFTKLLLVLFSFTLYFPLQAQSLKFHILHTSDEHSAFVPLPLLENKVGEKNPSIGGVARVAGAIKSIKNKHNGESFLTLSSGDIMGGSPYSWLILKNQTAEIDLLNEMGYDAMTIGNHEFDYGPEILADYFKRAGYKETGEKTAVIASNLDIPQNHPLLDIDIQENKIFQLPNGLKVGVFGILGKGAFKLATSAKPIEYIDMFDIAKKQVKLLQSQGADIIILLSHSGDDEDIEIAKKVEGINIILGGHYHIITEKPINVNNTYILHPSYFYKNLGHYVFEYDKTAKKLNILEHNNITMDYTISEDSLIASKVATYTDDLNKHLVAYTDSIFYNISQVNARTTFKMERVEYEEFGLGNFITDAMRFMGEKLTGSKVDFSFQGNGVIRSDIYPGEMPWSKNEVSFFDLATVSGLGMGPDKMPGYPMVSVYLTEEEVIRATQVTSILHQIYGDIFYLQFSGLRYTYDAGKALWLKIPFLNLPIPANKAVLSVEKYTGNGIQNTDEYEKLSPKNDRMYHVISDYYIASFLPMVGEVLPKLKIVLKDKNGNPIENIEEAIVYKTNGKEFKIWEAVSMYAKEFYDKGEDIPAYYSKKQGRITQKKGIPLAVWTYIALVVVLVFIWAVIKSLFKQRRRKN